MTTSDVRPDGRRTLLRLLILSSLITLPSAACHKDSGQRIGAAAWCFEKMRAQPWGATATTIPSTVIDVGVLRHVPYMSFRAGDYEVNVYGDPSSPAGVEAGVYGDKAADQAAKKNCLAYVKTILPEDADDSVVDALNEIQDTKTRDGLTFEVTPATAPDAYGGWWISVYDAVTLARVRASDTEMAAVSEVKASASSWTPAEISQARRSSFPSSSIPSSPAGDRVYVKGYHRKDGTYVAPYTRSKPRRKS